MTVHHIGCVVLSPDKDAVVFYIITLYFDVILHIIRVGVTVKCAVYHMGID